MRGSLVLRVPLCRIFLCNRGGAPCISFIWTNRGAVDDPKQDYFVLAGLAVFERGIYHLIKSVDDLVASWQLAPDPQEVEIHASPMYQGRRGTLWYPLERSRRVAMMLEALELLRGHNSIRAFGVAVHKAAIVPDSPLLYAYEKISHRFDNFLSRMYRCDDERQRGLMLMDASQYGSALQRLAKDLRDNGTRWGNIRNLPEAPYPVDSKASRIVQLADLVAYALLRKYESQDERFFAPIAGIFDAAGGVVHGLVHHKPLKVDCYCPACVSRQHGQSGQ